MPAVNPRISVTLPPSTAALLARLCSLTGNSQSSTVGELLMTCEPIFERMCLVMEAANEVATEAADEMSRANEEMAGSFKRAQGRMEQQLGLCLDEWEKGTGELLRAMEKVQRRARRKPATAAGTGTPKRSPARPCTAAAAGYPANRAAATPACNTGVRFQSEKRGKAHPPTDSGDFSA